MSRPSPRIYKTPFSAPYWRDAAADFKQVRTLAFSALMIAACVGLSYVPSIYIGDTGAKLTWGFLARALCSLVGGPINGLVFGLAEDTVSYLMNPGGPYFPGYALTTMLGNLTYALFLYRSRVTVVRVAFAKLLTNVQNVFLGSLWSMILYGKKSYWVYMTGSAFKNIITFPITLAALLVLLAALLPIMKRMGLLPAESKGKLELI